ncbi:MAG: SAVED domain-containing protein [Fervidobacterium sp.]
MRLSLYFESKPEEFINLLERGVVSLQEAIYVYNLFKDSWRNSNYLKRKIIHKLFYTIVKIVKADSKFNDVQLLVELFDGDVDFCYDLLESKYVEFDFPVVFANSSVDQNNAGSLVRGLVVFTRKLFTNMPEKKDAIENVMRLSGKSFSVIFDSDFVGNSFVLSLYIAVSLEKFFDDLTFTGELTIDKKILPADKLDTKEKISRLFNKKLISHFDLSTGDVSEILELLSSKRLRVPVLLSYTDKRNDPAILPKSYEKLLSATSSIHSRNLFEKLLGERLLYQKNYIKPGEFVREIISANTLLHKILARNWIPHIAIDGPASFAFGLGVCFGIHNPVVVYQFQSGNYYYCTLDLSDNPRKIRSQKVSIDNLTKIYFREIAELDKGEDIIFVIHLSTMDPTPDVINFARESKISSKGILISHKSAGNIDIGNWLDEVTEIYSVIDYVRTKFRFKKAHFFLNMPVSIAFGIGMALGHFIQGVVYSYNADDPEAKYYEAFKFIDLM